jgi:hypothetical protein
MIFVRYVQCFYSPCQQNMRIARPNTLYYGGVRHLCLPTGANMSSKKSYKNLTLQKTMVQKCHTGKQCPAHTQSYVKILPRKIHATPRRIICVGRTTKENSSKIFEKTRPFRRREEICSSYLLFSERYAVTIQNTKRNARV